MRKNNPSAFQAPSLRSKGRKVRAFTLVELIVVITILAILWTIAFISLQWYSRDARDSTRTADLWNMKTSLELYSLKTWKYPKPDNFSTVTSSWDIVWYQWVVWDQVTTNLKSLNEKPLDPLLNTPYIYSTTSSYKEYQVLAMYEWSVAYNPLINSANAAWEVLTPKLDWTYNWVYVQTTRYIIPTPSIITSEPWNITLTWTTIISQVVTNWINIPKIWSLQAKTWSLTLWTFTIAPKITKNSTDAEKVIAINAIQNTYTWSNLATQENIAYILNQTSTGQILALTKITLLKWQSSLTSNTSINTTPTPPAITDWRSKDPNCTLPDVQIGTQFWAWCNSTLWTWIEWGKKDDWTNWTIAWCYSYNATNTVANCSITDLKMASNSKANAWYTWTNANLDSAINNIWWKLYTWTSLDTNSDNLINSSDTNLVCWTWYHLPSDAEWSTAENTLFWSTCDTWLNAWNCAWVGWKNYSTNSATSIVSKLWIPLAGARSTDGATFYDRGYNTSLWSSTPSASNAYSRYFYWGYSTVSRDSNDSKLYGFSVRCIKD